MKKVFTLGLMMFALVFFGITTISTAYATSGESSPALCTDGIDNDEDTLIDLADGDCSDFAPLPDVAPTTAEETTADACTDGIDNDEDTLIDAADGDCDTYIQSLSAPVTPVVEKATPRRRSGSGRRGGSSSVPTLPTVLGASTSTDACVPYLTSYLKKGGSNDVEQVKKLQTFLNQFMNAGLPVTGYFGNLTEAAVKQLQSAHASEILNPWSQVDAKASSPTGWVYKTTQWFINTKAPNCAAIPFPTL